MHMPMHMPMPMPMPMPMDMDMDMDMDMHMHMHLDRRRHRVLLLAAQARNRTQHRIELEPNLRACICACTCTCTCSTCNGGVQYALKVHSRCNQGGYVASHLKAGPLAPLGLFGLSWPACVCGVWVGGAAPPPTSLSPVSHLYLQRL